MKVNFKASGYDIVYDIEVRAYYGDGEFVTIPASIIVRDQGDIFKKIDALCKNADCVESVHRWELIALRLTRKVEVL